MRAIANLLVAIGVWSAAAMASTPSAATAPSSSPSSVVCIPEVVVEGAGVPAPLVDDLATEARGLTEALRPRLGDEDCRPIVVTVVASMAQAADLDPPWRLPAWAAGAARPDARRIVVGVTAEGRVQDRRRTLHHELVHVLAHSAAGEADLPRWLDEGLARVLAGEHGVDDLRVLAQARIADRFLPLSALEEGFPAGSADAALAYAQSGRAVSLMFERNDEAVATLLRAMRDGATLDDALQRATGRAAWQVDLDMRRSVGLWAALATVGIETDLAMAGCGVAVAVFGVRARRRQRQRLLTMDDGEEPGREAAKATVARWTVPRASC